MPGRQRAGRRTRGRDRRSTSAARAAPSSSRPPTIGISALIADETGLRHPGRRLAELPAGDAGRRRGRGRRCGDEIAFETKTNATVTWSALATARRRGRASDVLAKTLSTLKLPATGDYYAWVASRVAHRQGAAPPADRRPRRQSEMGPAPPAIGAAAWLRRHEMRNAIARAARLPERPSRVHRNVRGIGWSDHPQRMAMAPASERGQVRTRLPSLPDSMIHAPPSWPTILPT